MHNRDISNIVMSVMKTRNERTTLVTLNVENRNNQIASITSSLERIHQRNVIYPSVRLYCVCFQKYDFRCRQHQFSTDEAWRSNAIRMNWTLTHWQQHCTMTILQGIHTRHDLREDATRIQDYNVVSMISQWENEGHSPICIVRISLQALGALLKHSNCM